MILTNVEQEGTKVIQMEGYCTLYTSSIKVYKWEPFVQMEGHCTHIDVQFFASLSFLSKRVKL